MVKDAETNLLPSLTLLDVCRKVGVSRIIFVSSGGTIYGRPLQIPTPETAPTEPITAYGVSKLATEKYLALCERLYGLDYRVLRVTNPFGPYQLTLKNQGVIAALISHAIRRQPVEIWGDGTVVRDFIYIDDVVDALIAAAEDRGAERIFNIGSGVGRSLREVIAEIECLIEMRLDIVWKPGRSVDVPISVVAIDRATEILRWKPKVSFQSGLEHTIKWWYGREKVTIS